MENATPPFIKLSYSQKLSYQREIISRRADDSVIQIPEPELIWGVHFLKFKINSGLRTFYFLDSQYI